MARCLNPITIKRPGLSMSPHSCPSVFWKDNLRPYMSDELVVPCGKCIQCLKNKQNSMVVRIKREAEKRGSLVFVTLTYDNDHLPLAQSLWSIDRESGEMVRETEPELISTGRFPDGLRLSMINEMPCTSVPRYLEVPILGFSFADPGKDYVVRITPSVCREDVRLWLKRARVAYKRAFDKALDIAYCCVLEYGPRTCRPHAHLAIMGASVDTVRWLCRQWTYGYFDCQEVKMDLSKSEDPFSAVAFYIGKYMSKGKFECESVKVGASEKPRVCQSIGLGTGELDKIKPYVCAFDLFGSYNLDTLCFDSGSKLTQQQLVVLCEEIPKRLVYRLNEKVVLPLPRLIRQRIFYNKKVYEKETENGKEVFEKFSPTALWYVVACAIRDKYAEMDRREFEQFCAGHAERALVENCVEYAHYKEVNSSLEATAREKNLQIFYSKSIF